MEVRDLEVLAWRLFEESNDAVFVLDCRTETIQQANPVAQRLTGLRWRELRGRRLDELVRGPADQLNRLLSAVRETGFFHSQETYFLLRAQSEPLPINVSASRVHAPSGSLGLVVVRDVSDRKQAEETLRAFGVELQKQVDLQTKELRAANQQLAREIEERKEVEQTLHDTNLKLRDAIDKLEHAKEYSIRRERLHALEQVAGGIAHDINNSLSAVTAFSELILGNDLDDQTRQWADSVHTAAKDIAGIVTRLRQFYGDPVEQGTSRIINVEDLANEIVQLTRPKWHDESLREQKHITVMVFAEASPNIVGDISALRSVLTNLVFNGVDAIEESGHITLRIVEESPMAVIEIVDNGTGMTSAELRRCLEPFYTTKTKGTGLGLSVCHGILKSHSGRIEIDSTPGKGTTIRVFLPLFVEAQLMTTGDEVDVAATTAERSLKGKRVLYIDDNQAARSSNAMLLESLGLAVDTAEDGECGLELFLEQPYDAVITDMSMPGLDGLQLTTQVKQVQPTMPVVLISGWLLLDTHYRPGMIPPDRVLNKPCSSQHLAGTLVRLFEPDMS